MLSRTTGQQELEGVSLAQFVVIQEEFGVEPEETSVRKALHEETSVNNLDPCGFNRELNQCQ